jgi:putative ABC transport system ATP-binding protein
MSAQPLMQLRDVTVTYGRGDSRVVALDHATLAIEDGDSVALWGRSGSGKTTALHVMGGLTVPTEGSVDWQGSPLSSLDGRARGRARAHGIAYVFQGANLLPTLTAFENVSFARHVAQAGTRFSPIDLLGLVGLAHKADSLPSELSGGEAQRVALARAVAQSPRLLLCDEPTGHLDSDTSERVLDLIDALRRELGFTLVIATHDAGVVARVDREIEILDGKIVRQGAYA